MAGKGSRRDGKPQSPKRLRRRLQKAEARLAVARDKRDRAQARVEALGMIADEVRATLREVERAAGEVDGAAALERAAALENAADPGKIAVPEKGSEERAPGPRRSTPLSRRSPPRLDGSSGG